MGYNRQSGLGGKKKKCSPVSKMGSKEYILCLKKPRERSRQNLGRPPDLYHSLYYIKTIIIKSDHKLCFRKQWACLQLLCSSTGTQLFSDAYCTIA